jgi:hypothetical protein
LDQPIPFLVDAANLASAKIEQVHSLSTCNFTDHTSGKPAIG